MANDKVNEIEKIKNVFFVVNRFFSFWSQLPILDFKVFNKKFDHGSWFGCLRFHFCVSCLTNCYHIFRSVSCFVKDERSFRVDFWISSDLCFYKEFFFFSQIKYLTITLLANVLIIEAINRVGTRNKKLKLLAS